MLDVNGSTAIDSIAASCARAAEETESDHSKPASSSDRGAICVLDRTEKYSALEGDESTCGRCSATAQEAQVCLTVVDATSQLGRRRRRSQR